MINTQRLFSLFQFGNNVLYSVNDVCNLRFQNDDGVEVDEEGYRIIPKDTENILYSHTQEKLLKLPFSTWSVMYHIIYLKFCFVFCTIV
jgi:hypothetical protein